MSYRFSRSLKVCLLAGASMLAAGSAFAQETTAEEPAEVEEVVVVGSQIRGANPTGVLPVTVMTSDEIDAAAPSSGDELFRSIPQAGDVSFNEGRTTGGINDARGDTASINLRGLGTGNTLMLLNGRRMVLHPAIQVENLVPVATVNTNTIPVLGVRRVEVLRDGAAAIYGTDAVAGVINTVLKDSFDGLTIGVEASDISHSDMQEYDFDFEWGRDFNGGRSNVSVFGSYTSRDALWAREREFSANSDMRPLVAGTPFAGDTDWRNTSTDTIWAEFQRVNASYAPVTTTLTINGQNLTTSGIFHVQPATNPGCIGPTTNGVCFDNSSLSTVSEDENLRYNDNYARTLIGEVDRYNLFTFFNHEFDGGLEAFAEVGLFYSDYLGNREQDTPLATQRLFVPAANYYNPFGPTGSPNRVPVTNAPAAGVTFELIDYRPVDAGDQSIEVEQTVTRYLAGLRGEFAGWDWESAFLYSRAETEDVMSSVSMTLWQQALARNTPDAYNPFTGGDPLNPSALDSSPNPQDVIDDIVVPVTRNSHTSMAMWDLKLSKRDLFRLPGGDVGVATGVELRRETYGDDRDDRLDGTINFTPLSGPGVAPISDVMGVSPTPDTSGARNVQAAYLEFAVPVVSRDMNIPLVRELDLQLAARWENYTAFGDVLKPKVALGWRPIDQLLLRASYSEGFRAPNLPQIHEQGILRNNGRTDWIRCEAALRKGLIPNFNACTSDPDVVGPSVSVQSNRSGSETLKPEESENFTAGFVFTPDFLPEELGRITLTGDYWNIEQTDIIGIFGDANHLTLDYLERVNLTGPAANDNVIRAAPTAAEIAFFAGSGIDPVGQVVQVIDNYRNLSPREVEGLDFTVDYELDDTPFGDFDLSLNFARLLTFYQAPGPEQADLLAAQTAGLIDPFINIAGAEDLIEENGRPKWRASGSLTWRMGMIGAGWYTSYVGAVNDTSASLADGTLWRVKQQQTHNLYFQVTFDEGIVNDLRLRIGVRNLEDKMPPISDADLGYIGDLHSPRGRTYYASLRKRF